jgi:hypothetical protein
VLVGGLEERGFLVVGPHAEDVAVLGLRGQWVRGLYLRLGTRKRGLTSLWAKTSLSRMFLVLP